MSKNNSTSGNSSTAKSDFMFGVSAFKTGFEKTANLCESVGEFNKDTLAAYIESTTVAGTGLQSVVQASSSYAKQAIENALAASKTIMSSKSINEVLEIQTGFANTAFANYMSHLSHFNETLVTAAKKTCAPLQTRAEAAAALIPSITA